MGQRQETEGALPGYRCPVCRGILQYMPGENGPGVWKCGKGHSFDRAASGYVNLLPANRKHSKLPGDNREMVRARRDFLSLGYYAPLRDLLVSQILKQVSGSSLVLADAGCGEGYYTQGIVQDLRKAGRKVTGYGFDLSKTAVQYAAKRDDSLFYAVASIFDLPLMDNTADILLSLFAPISPEEFARVTLPGGILLVAAPSPRHLFGLKQVLYDRPYENPVEPPALAGFQLEETTQLDYEVTLTTHQAIMDLFWMTPYAYNSHREAARRLEGLNTLSTPVGFAVSRYRRAAR